MHPTFLTCALAALLGCSAACMSQSPPSPTAMRTYAPGWFAGAYRNVSEASGQPTLWSLLGAGLHSPGPRSRQQVQLQCAGRRLDVRLFEDGKLIAVRRRGCELAAGGLVAARRVGRRMVRPGYGVAGWTRMTLWCEADRSLFLERETSGLAVVAWLPWPFGQLRALFGPYGVAPPAELGPARDAPRL